MTTLSESAVRLLRDALNFYATAENWRSPSKGFALQYDPEPSPLKVDSGARAREALKLLTDPP